MGPQSGRMNLRAPECSGRLGGVSRAEQPAAIGRALRELQSTSVGVFPYRRQSMSLLLRLLFVKILVTNGCVWAEELNLSNPEECFPAIGGKVFTPSVKTGDVVLSGSSPAYIWRETVKRLHSNLSNNRELIEEVLQKDSELCQAVGVMLLCPYIWEASIRRRCLGPRQCRKRPRRTKRPAPRQAFHRSPSAWKSRRARAIRDFRSRTVLSFDMGDESTPLHPDLVPYIEDGAGGSCRGVCTPP